MSARYPRQRGIALVLVLWVITLLTVIAGSFVYSTRTQTRLTGNLVSLAQAAALADAGVYRGIYEMYKPQTDTERWKADGQAHVYEQEGAQAQVVIVDEAAKIDLNSAAEPLLKGLFLSVGVDEDTAAQLLDAVVDWRDADDLPRAQGAEQDAYAAAGLDYGPANAPFATVEDLRLVLGMTPDIYRAVAGALTVYSRSPGINPLTASRQVLLALPDATPEDVDAYIASREEFLAAGQVPPPFPPAAGFSSSGTSQVYNFKSFAALPDGAAFTREAVARLTREPAKPIVFLKWGEAQP